MEQYKATKKIKYIHSLNTFIMSSLNRISLVVLLFYAASAHLKAQEGMNLVPNPSFEEHTGCYVLTDHCSEWFTLSSTSDYIHFCSDYEYNIGAGYQLPRTGEAYTGYINYALNHPAGSNIREHLGVTLSTPMLVGEKYHISFYVSSGYTNTVFNIATNNIGAMFTTYTYYDLMGNDIPNPNFAHLNENSIIADTVGWVKISGSFIADSAYTYMILGNFYDDEFTDTLNFPFLIPNTVRYSYYYVDDVCVSLDSSYCELWSDVSTPVFSKANISYFPNPVNDVLYVKSEYPIHFYELVNFWGNQFFLKRI